jgi:hypothetical protein
VERENADEGLPKRVLIAIGLSEATDRDGGGSAGHGGVAEAPIGVSVMSNGVSQILT